MGTLLTTHIAIPLYVTALSLLSYNTFRDPSMYSICSGYVTVALLVLGQVLVEFIVVVDITGGTATGE